MGVLLKLENNTLRMADETSPGNGIGTNENVSPIINASEKHQKESSLTKLNTTCNKNDSEEEKITKDLGAKEKIELDNNINCDKDDKNPTKYMRLADEDEGNEADEEDESEKDDNNVDSKKPSSKKVYNNSGNTTDNNCGKITKVDTDVMLTESNDKEEEEVVKQEDGNKNNREKVNLENEVEDHGSRQ